MLGAPFYGIGPASPFYSGVYNAQPGGATHSYSLVSAPIPPQFSQQAPFPTSKPWTSAPQLPLPNASYPPPNLTYAPVGGYGDDGYDEGDIPPPEQDEDEFSAVSSQTAASADNPGGGVFHHPYSRPAGGGILAPQPYVRSVPSYPDTTGGSLALSLTTGAESAEAELEDPPLVADTDPALQAIDATGLAEAANQAIAEHYSLTGRLDANTASIAGSIRDRDGSVPSSVWALEVTRRVLDLWRSKAGADSRSTAAGSVSRHSAGGSTTAEHSVRHAITHAHRVTKLMLGSPAHAAGLVPFFDHLVALDDIKLGPDLAWFVRYTSQRVGKAIKVDVYNTRTHSHRTCTVHPGSEWDPSGTRGLLGCTLRWVDVNAAHFAARRVFQVKLDGNACLAGITEGQDWLVGLQYGSPAASNACAFSSPDDYEMALDELGEEAGRFPLAIAMVYDETDNTIREILCRTPLGLTVYGPKQCVLPVGPEVPKLAFVTNHRILDPPPPPPPLPPPPEGTAEDDDDPPGKPHKGLDDPFLAPKLPPEVPQDRGCGERLCSGRMRGVWTFTACSLLWCIAGGVYLICVFIVSREQPCSQPLAPWALVSGISALFIPLAMWTLFVLCLRIPTAKWQQATVWGSLLGILLLLFVIAWFAVGNAWAYSTTAPTDCDPFLWWSDVAALIGCYVTLAFTLCVGTAYACGRARKGQRLRVRDMARTLKPSTSPGGCRSCLTCAWCAKCCQRPRCSAPTCGCCVRCWRIFRCWSCRQPPESPITTRNPVPQSDTQPINPV